MFFLVTSVLYFIGKCHSNVAAKIIFPFPMSAEINWGIIITCKRSQRLVHLSPRGTAFHVGVAARLLVLKRKCGNAHKKRAVFNST